MPKFTTDQIKDELTALADTEAQAAPFYLKRELQRRKNAGRKPTSNLSRKEQVKRNVANYRKRQKEKTQS